MEPTRIANAVPSPSCAGSLTPAQQDLVIRHLPLQLSVIDEDGVLVYWQGDLFSDCEPQFIGRHINACHSEHSREMIARMTAAFRAGSQDEAVFRRLEDGRLNLTRYRALRDAEGTYRGIVETHQDISELRLLEGEKLDLDW
jgi:DUF438 domain-containing protein